MSGIFGAATAKVNSYSDKSILPMVSWNRIFGSYKEEIYSSNGISMGCCIESISDKYVQTDPIIRAGHIIGVIDAVVFNREEILENWIENKNLSDAELVFCYVNKYGPDALKNINGDFTGAIYNEVTKKLLLFRDHMGVRPLFYYKSESIIAFSTDIRGLLANPYVSTEIDEDWIFKTVSGYDIDTIDGTPYRGVSCVRPATYLYVSQEKEKLIYKESRYWNLAERKVCLYSEKEYINRLRELVTDAVERRLNAFSGPAGAELSGGLDSGVIDILINRSGRECYYFSWSIDPEELKLADNDERLIIQDICKQEGITCHYMHFGDECDELTAECMKKAGIHVPDTGSQDLRFAYPFNANTYKILVGAFKAREKGAKVMFTGHGGDEGVSHRSDLYELFLHGEIYQYFKQIWITSGDKHRLIRTTKRAIKNIFNSIKDRRRTYLNWYASPELLNLNFSKGKKNPKTGNIQFDYDPVSYIESGGSRNRLENLAFFGALCGVRYFVPFMDHRVIDFAVSIPRYLYIQNGIRRYIFREAFKDIMPESLYTLKVKEDQSVKNIEPDSDWYKKYEERKLEIINSLDREYWANYLDYSLIDELARSGEPTDDQLAIELKSQKALLKCALADNLLRKAKNNGLDNKILQS